MRILMVLLFACVYLLGGDIQSQAEQPIPAKPTILGRWIETPESLRAKFKGAKLEEQPTLYYHTVELFPDGTGVSILRIPGPRELTTSFTWSLSDDRQRIKTEDKQSGRVYVQRIVKMTSDELETDGPGFLAGHYRRAR